MMGFKSQALNELGGSGDRGIACVSEYGRMHYLSRF